MQMFDYIIGFIFEELTFSLNEIIDRTRQQLAATFTNMQLLMYWNIGNRINKDVLCGKRAEYGAQIVSTLSTQLQRQYSQEESGSGTLTVL